MSDYTLESGLVVRTRADDPRAWDSNPNGPGVNDPPQTVGPTSSEGFGNTHVMYPELTAAEMQQTAAVAAPPVQAWSGWPVEWTTPNWGTSTPGGIGDIINRVSVVFGSIDLNASILSTMPPYRLADENGDGVTEVVESVPWMVNPQPEVYTGWSEMMKQLVISYYGNGEVFLWATSRNADYSVRTFVMLNPGWVDIEMLGQYRTYYMNDVDITEDVLHIRYASWPGHAHGHGPLEALAYTLFGAAAMERYQANLALRGGIPWGALTAPGNLSETQATLMRDRFVASRMSANGAPAVLSGGVTLAPFTISPKDMALLELRQFDEARCAVLLGVPPLLMALPSGDTSMTYRNTEMVYNFHWRAYLRPKAATIMEAISQWALPDEQCAELNRDEYTRPGFKDRADAWSVLFNIYDPETGKHAVTIEEIRTAERLDGASEAYSSVSPQYPVVSPPTTGSP